MRRVAWDTTLGTTGWLEFSSDALQRRYRSSTVAGAVQAFLTRHAQAFGLDDARSAVAEIGRRNSDGMVHVRFRQRWNGIPIDGSDLRLHVRTVNGGYVVETANGRMYADIAAPTSPSITVATAVEIAASRLGDPAGLTVDSSEVGPTSIVPMGTRYALAYSIRNAQARLTVDASSGQVLDSIPLSQSARIPGSPSLGATRSAAERPSRGGRSPVTGARVALGYESGNGDDALNTPQQFLVFNTGSNFELRSNALGTAISEVVVRELAGEHPMSNCTTFAVATNPIRAWSNTPTGRQQVSGLVNTLGSGIFYRDSLGRRSYDDGNPGAAVNVCVNGAEFIAPGQENFQSFANGNFTLGFVRDYLPTFLGSAAARDVVTHEFSHLVMLHDSVALTDVQARAVNEGLADYFGARHHGSACHAADALFYCERDLTTVRVFEDNTPPGAGDPDAHYWGQVVSGALWSVASLSSALGHDVDRATYDAIRYYMIAAETMLHTRAAIIRAFQDRMHANQTLTVAVPNLEDAFAFRDVGQPAVRLYNELPPECGWAFRLDPGGSKVLRTYAVTFWDGNEVNQDQSLVNAGFVSTVADLAARRGTRSFFVASPAGSNGHTPSDGHYHGVRVRFEDGPIILDYYKYWGPEYFCEEQPQMSVRAPIVAGNGEAPRRLSVRQVVGDGSLVVPSLSGGSGQVGQPAPGLAAQVAREGLLSFEYGVPLGAAGQTSVRVYDLRGRLLRTISERGGVPGWTRVTWDGRDDSGNMVAQGVYVAVIGAATEIVRTRLIVPAR